MKVKYKGRSKRFVFENKIFDLKDGDIIELPYKYKEKFQTNAYLKKHFTILTRKGKTKLQETLDNIILILKNHERRLNKLEELL